MTRKKKTTRKRSVRQTAPPKVKMMSVIMKEMIARILIGDDPSDDASAVALFLANIAWNRAIGVPEQKGFVKKQVARMKPPVRNFWKPFVDKDYNKLIDVLIEYKIKHYPDDDRYVAGASIAEDVGDHLTVLWMQSSVISIVHDRYWHEFISCVYDVISHTRIDVNGNFLFFESPPFRKLIKVRKDGFKVFEKFSNGSTAAKVPVKSLPNYAPVHSWAGSHLNLN